MKHTHIFLIMFCFVILSSINVSAKFFNGVNFTEELLVEDFEYINSFASRGWDFEITSGCTLPDTTPFDSSALGGTLCFGRHNLTENCETPATTVILKKEDEFDNLNSGRALFELDFRIGTENDDTFTMFTISCGNFNTFNMLYNEINNNITFTNNRIGGDNCDNIPYSLDTFNNLKVDIDFENSLYNLYIDDVVFCSLKELGTEGTKCMTGVKLNYGDVQDGNVSICLDNIEVHSTEVPSVLSRVGQPCDEDTDCDSDSCSALNVCVLKLNNQGCDENSECLSTECLNNKCTKPSMAQLIDASKTEQFGDDPQTNNIISIFIMTGVALIVVIVGATGGSALAGIFGGILLFLITGIGFALLGWLSAFILFGIFIVLLIGLVFAFVMGGGSS